MKRFATMGIILVTGLVLSIGASGRNPSTPDVSTIKFVKEGIIISPVYAITVEYNTYVVYKEPTKSAPTVAGELFFGNQLSFVAPVVNQRLSFDAERRQAIPENKGPSNKIYAELGNSIAYMRV